VTYSHPNAGRTSNAQPHRMNPVRL
jgi:hypothetical protein